MSCSHTLFPVYLTYPVLSQHIWYTYAYRLCGRGGSINSHPGNKIFRTWVGERKETYMLCTTKSGKTNITNSIFKRVKAQRPPGRFLQKVKDPGTPDPYNISGWWVEIDDTKALAKISQALREGGKLYLPCYHILCFITWLYSHLVSSCYILRRLHSSGLSCYTWWQEEELTTANKEGVPEKEYTTKA